MKKFFVSRKSAATNAEEEICSAWDHDPVRGRSETTVFS
jgi:hypothetical protein